MTLTRVIYLSASKILSRLGWLVVPLKNSKGFTVLFSGKAEIAGAPPDRLARASQIATYVFGESGQIVSSRTNLRGGNHYGPHHYAMSNGTGITQKITSSPREILISKWMWHLQSSERSSNFEVAPTFWEVNEGPVGGGGEIFLETHNPCSEKDLKSDSFAVEVGRLGFALESFLAEAPPRALEFPAPDPVAKVAELLSRAGVRPPQTEFLKIVSDLLRHQPLVRCHGDLGWLNIVRHRENGSLLAIDFADIRCFHPGAALFNFGSARQRFKDLMLDAYIQESQRPALPVRLAFNLQVLIQNLEIGISTGRKERRIARQFSQDCSVIEALI